MPPDSDINGHQNGHQGYRVKVCVLARSSW